MCWSWHVSLAWAVAESALTAAAVVAQWRIRRHDIYSMTPLSRRHVYRVGCFLPIVLTVIAVEWAEFGVWWFGDPQPFSTTLQDPQRACAECTTANWAFTFVCGLAISLQPVVTMYFAYKTHHSTAHSLSDISIRRWKTWFESSIERYIDQRARSSSLNNNNSTVEETEEANGVDLSTHLPLRKRQTGDDNARSPSPSSSSSSSSSSSGGDTAEDMMILMRDGESASSAFEDSGSNSFSQNESLCSVYTAESSLQGDQMGDRERFYAPFIGAFLCSAAMILSYVVGEISGTAQSCDNTYHTASLSAQCTCSFIGDNGHLVWNFAMPCRALQYIPNMFTYSIFFNILPLFYGPFWMGLVMFWALLLFVVEFIYFRGSGEVFSIWCWSGGVISCFYLASSMMLFLPRMYDQLEAGGLNNSTIGMVRELLTVVHFQWTNRFRFRKTPLPYTPSSRSAASIERENKQRNHQQQQQQQCIPSSSSSALVLEKSSSALLSSSTLSV